MIANEVLANIGLEMGGHKKGEYQFLDPHDDLNMSQSTNDSYPTAIKVALIMRNEKLIAELEQLVVSFRKKGNEFLPVLKMAGRVTGTQCARPSAGNSMPRGVDRARLHSQSDAEYLYGRLRATAIGTGINAPRVTRRSAPPSSRS
jgi:aspartate ammonia-lyase